MAGRHHHQLRAKVSGLVGSSIEGSHGWRVAGEGKQARRVGTITSFGQM